MNSSILKKHVFEEHVFEEHVFERARLKNTFIFDLMEFGPSKPSITRPKISIYEYAGIITQLAEYIFTLKDLDDYIDSPQVNNIIDPCRIAYQLLKEGKIDIQIDRGYETILYSQCEKDELIEKEIENYLNERDTNRKELLFDKIFA